MTPMTEQQEREQYEAIVAKERARRQRDAAKRKRKKPRVPCPTRDEIIAKGFGHLLRKS